MTNLYGVIEQSDNINEEYVYTLGSNGNIPIVLLILKASGYGNAVERYLSLYSYTEKAKTLAKELFNQNPTLDTDIKEIVDIFDQRDPVSQARMHEEFKKNGFPVFDSVSKQRVSVIDTLKNYPKDAILDFNMYANQLATYMAMKTPNYDGGREGVPQACSLSYIAFYQREEFVKATEAVNNAFIYLVQEVIRIMKLRNININENNMTLNMPNYKAISFRMPMYPGF